MDRVVVYGLGNNFIFSYYELSQYYDIVAVSDASEEKIGESFYGHVAQKITSIPKQLYQYVVITPANHKGIIESLSNQGIEREKIITLQEAYDRIPVEEWTKGKINNINMNISYKYAFILYGGMGDLIVAKLWINKLINIYKLSPEKISLFFSKSNLEDGRFIFNDLVAEDRCFIINELAGCEIVDKFSVIFRFCIIPEVLKFYKEIVESDDGFHVYVKRIFDENIRGYNRGLFTSEKYYKTLTKYLIEKNVVYHTAYDIFGELGADLDDRATLSVANINEQEYLKQVGLFGKKYITINTGLNTEYSKKKNTREWPFVKWNQLAEEIKKKYPEKLVVQVGLKLKEDDDIVADVHLNGRTNLEQIAIVLKNAEKHIDYDGGLVHVNHSVGGKSIVLMGPSSEENHAYPENIYISSIVCKACEWTSSDWLSNCPKGYECPKCMTEINVETVLNFI